MAARRFVSFLPPFLFAVIIYKNKKNSAEAKFIVKFGGLEKMLYLCSDFSI